MFKVIAVMFAGIALGYLFRNKDLQFIPKLISISIMLLLFLLGIAVGNNDQILSNLNTLGMEALLLTLGGLTGSVLCAWAIYKWVFNSKNNRS
ncbi:MAG: LysO family transporter [Marinifilaceae bacterium]